MKYIFGILILVFSMHSYAEKIQTHTVIDRFAQTSSEYYTLTFSKRVLDEIENECEKRCTLTFSKEYFFVDGYTILDDVKPTKEIKVRIKIGNEIFNGVCKFNQIRTGCFVKFNNVSTSQITSKLNSFKGYFALETNQIFQKSEYRYEGQIQKGVFFTEIE
jgi:hypothetical protein